MLDTISLVTFFLLILLSYNVSLLSEIYFFTYFTLSKYERASNQNIYNQGIKVQVTTKDIK